MFGGIRRLTLDLIAVAAEGFAPFNRTAEQEAVARLEASWEPLVELTPGLGAYINEVGAVRSHQRDYAANDSTRLLRLRRMLPSLSGATTTSVS